MKCCFDNSFLNSILQKMVVWEVCLLFLMLAFALMIASMWSHHQPLSHPPCHIGAFSWNLCPMSNSSIFCSEHDWRSYKSPPFVRLILIQLTLTQYSIWLHMFQNSVKFSWNKRIFQSYFFSPIDICRAKKVNVTIDELETYIFDGILWNLW